MGLTIGHRVVAVCDADEANVNIFGKGVYEGESPIDDADDQLMAIAALFGIHSPKIKLDGGATIRGYQCYIVEEEKFQDWVAERTVKEVPLDTPGITEIPELSPEDFQGLDADTFNPGGAPDKPTAATHEELP